VISNITQEQMDAPLIGKVSFNGDPGSVSNLNLFGSLIDKRLQAINYKFNVRGWLTDINDIENNGSLKALDKYSDLFDFRINYNKVEGNNNGTPLYNGNIAQTLWKSKNGDTQTRGYNYGYDDLNRVTEAKSYKGTVTSMTHTDTHTLADLTYDQNGNILTLKRFGTDINNSPADLWDNLSYQYNGNRLNNVSDASTHPTYEDFGFKDGNDHIVTQNNDYLYDDNGNIVKDRNKGMDNIVYNYLNLPKTVTVNNGNESGTITYIYDAAGLKLKKIAQIGTNAIIHTEYVNGYVYSDQENVGSIQLQFFTHPEGYIEPMVQNGIRSKYSVKGFDTDTGGITYSDFKYVFQYRDHLGNIRLSYSDSDLDGTIDPSSEIIEESNYYPFGLKQKGYNNVVSSNGNGLAQAYKFGGKEQNQELGLEWYDFGARNYDASIGRWMNLDPLAELMRRHSPYTYAFDNPIFYLDPDGRMTFGSSTVGDLTSGFRPQTSGVTFSEFDADKVEGASSNLAGNSITSNPGSFISEGSGGSGAFAQIAANFAQKDLSLEGNVGENTKNGGCPFPPCNGSNFGQTPVFDFDSLDGVGATTGETMLTLSHKTIGGAGALELIGGGAVFKAPKVLTALFSANKATKLSSLILNATTKQLQTKFKHAVDFGIKGNWNKAAAGKFSAAINQHVNAASTKIIQGSYRGNSVTHYLNSKTGLNVISSKSGQFISGWKLNANQLGNVLKHGRL